MSGFINTLEFAFSVTGPIFIILSLGIFLKRKNIINDAFIEAGSKLVFNVTLPTLLFISISQTQISKSANLAMIAYGIGATLVLFTLLQWLTTYFIEPVADRGVVVQGAFRSNMGIIGLAYCVNAYGNTGLATASVYMGLLTILFNILSVITLSRSLTAQDPSWRPIIKGIARNPLIIGIILALPFAWLEWSLPKVLLQSGEYFAKMTLPLALLCTGATLNFNAMRKALGKTLSASLGKLILVPLVFAVAGIWPGFRGMELGILMLMAFSPTAAASYIMVRAMGGNAVLAANIIAMTTVGSLLSTSLGIVLLKHLNWM
ncbi:MAG: transporter [Proteobacteria bacterium]|nr:MAG: transporter [Pseudomonadota bacterium]